MSKNSHQNHSLKPWAMIPIKISNTDPTSGLIVHSRAEIVRKDGSVTEFEALKHTLILMEKLLV